MPLNESVKERHERELLQILRDLERHPRWKGMLRQDSSVPQDEACPPGYDDGPRESYPDVA